MEELEEKDAEGPDVRFEGLGFTLENFESHVVVGSTETLPVLLRGEIVGPSEVGNFGVKLVVQQNVFELQISVHDLPGMKVGDCLADLKKEADWIDVTGLGFF